MKVSYSELLPLTGDGGFHKIKLNIRFIFYLSLV